MLPTSISTGELRKLTGYSKAAVVGFEQAGIITRSGRDAWPMPATLVQLTAHLRDRHAHRSSADEQWRLARARGAELRNQERLGLLAPTSFLEQILDQCLGYLRSDFSGLPATFTRDAKERRRLDDLLRKCLERLADEFAKKSAELKQQAARAANRRTA